MALSCFIASDGGNRIRKLSSLFHVQSETCQILKGVSFTEVKKKIPEFFGSDSICHHHQSDLFHPCHFPSIAFPEEQKIGISERTYNRALS
jgi:hypothetical protein